MLDQLVESKSNAKENARRSEFMLITLFLAVAIVLFMWTRDLFGKDYGMGADDLSLTTLVAPVPIPEEEPPEPEKKQEKEPDVDVRKELIQNIMSSPVKPPEKITVERISFKQLRLDTMAKLGDTDSDTGAIVGARDAGVVGSGSPQGLGTTPPPPPTTDEEPPPPVKKAPPKTVSGGVMNGKATSLPKPAYPAAARAVRAAGAVSVQVLIGENGSVISANAVSGHPLLRAAAEGAARGARFSPTLLSGQPVKVSGVITYNFVP